MNASQFLRTKIYISIFMLLATGSVVAETAKTKDQKMTELFYTISSNIREFLDNPSEESHLDKTKWKMQQLPFAERQLFSQYIAEFVTINAHDYNISDVIHGMNWLELTSDKHTQFHDALAEIAKETITHSDQEKVNMMNNAQNPLIKQRIAEEIVMGDGYDDFPSVEKLDVIRNLRTTQFESGPSLRFSELKDVISGDPTIDYLALMQEANIVDKSYIACAVMGEGIQAYEDDKHSDEDDEIVDESGRVLSYQELPISSQRKDIFARKNIFATLSQLTSFLTEATPEEAQKMCDISKLLSDFKMYKAISADQYNHLMNTIKADTNVTQVVPKRLQVKQPVITSTEGCNLKRARRTLLREDSGFIMIGSDIDISYGNQQCSLAYYITKDGTAVLTFSKGNQIVDEQVMPKEELMKYLKSNTNP